MTNADEIDIDEAQIPRLAELAVQQAYNAAVAAGKSMVEARDGMIVEVFPDGTLREIKRIEPPFPVTMGQTISLR